MNQSLALGPQAGGNVKSGFWTKAEPMRQILLLDSRWFDYARIVRAVCCLLVGLAFTGCQAVTNPVAAGIPVRHLPPEFLGRSRELEQPIPLNNLRQQPPAVYRLLPGDILGIYIEGILGERTQPPPVRLSEQGKPTLGYPIPVREDGTVSLPLIDPVRVQGMSIAEAERAIRTAYTVTKEILVPGRERIIVTLMAPRQYHVLVIRQDAPSNSGNTANITFSPGIVGGGTEFLGPRRKGTGVALDLSAYENDLLNALTRSGGLPGTDAKNEVVIQRGGASRSTGMNGQFPCPGPAGSRASEQFVRIPLRLPPGAPIPFRPEDIILQDGDIVYIEARDAEVFYTGGILISGQYPLPRDHDLNIVQAIALVHGPLVNGVNSSNNFTGQLTGGGVGTPNPSQVTVLRQLPGHGQLNIRVDLNRALCDPRERLLVQPGDIIVLQSSVGEALVQYFTTSLFKLNFIGTILRQRDATATTTITAP